MKIIFSFLICCIFINCTLLKIQSSKNNFLHPGTLKRTWMLVYINNYKKDFLIENQVHLSINDSAFTAYAGCNKIRGLYKTNNTTKIQFHSVISTKKFCETTNQLETCYLNKLNSIKYYSIKGHFLVLKTTTNDSLKFIAQDWD